MKNANLDTKELLLSRNWFSSSNNISIGNEDSNLVIKCDLVNNYKYISYLDKNNEFDILPQYSFGIESCYTLSIFFKAKVVGDVDIKLCIVEYSDKDKVKVNLIDLDNEIRIALHYPTKSIRIVIKVCGKGEAIVEDIQIKKNKPISLTKKHYQNMVTQENLDNITATEFSNDYIKFTKNMIEKREFKFYNIAPLKFEDEINWIDERLRGRSFLKTLNGFEWLIDFIKSFEETKDVSILQDGFNFILNWEINNPYIGKTRMMNWNDHATAIRVRMLIIFLFKSKEHLEVDKLNLILNMIINHNNILSSQEFYSGLNNHGMFQDLSVIISYYYFKDYIYKKDLDVAKLRLKKYLKFIFCDGVHKEHSPFYHFMILNTIKLYSESLISYDKELSQWLAKLIDECTLFSCHIIMPNGYLPVVGDTTKEVPADAYLRDMSKPDVIYKSMEYLYSCTSGKEGIAPKANAVVFKEAGYAIFRNSWEYKSKSTYVLFIAAYHVSYHKHSDDLSFLLYSDGDIINEAGSYGYEYSNDLCKYCYSSFGHNTLIVNKEGLPRIDGKYDKLKINTFEINENDYSVVGTCSRYEDVIHTRKLHYFKRPEKLVVYDDIVSDKNNEYDLLFHIASGITPIIIENNVYMYRSNKLICKIYFKATTNYILNLFYGNQNKTFKGYYFEKQREEKENYVLVASFKGISVKIETQFELYTNI